MIKSKYSEMVTRNRFLFSNGAICKVHNVTTKAVTFHLKVPSTLATTFKDLADYCSYNPFARYMGRYLGESQEQGKTYKQYVFSIFNETRETE